MSTLTMPARVVELELSRIVRDPELQPRETLDAETVTQYAEDKLAGIEFPPVVVYFDGDRYWLSQGFHRAAADESIGAVMVLAEVRKGTREEAIWDAAGSNKEHDSVGRRRSNRDKRRAAEMALRIRPHLTNCLIAEQVGVSDPFVGKVRATIPVPNGSEQDRRTGKDGRSYKATKDKSKAPPSDPEPTVNGTASTTPDQQSSAPVRHEPEPEPEPESPLATASESPASNEAETEPDPEPDLEPDPQPEAEPSPEPHDPFQLVETPKPKAETRHAFNQTNDMVDWARWTWNPVTGCEHNCVYCYARDIANRFYPEKFEPTFRPERLDAPRHTTLPREAKAATDPVSLTAWRNVFVCSMADLFGRWVPDDWIQSVLDSCRQSPQWNYLFLTKFPNRYEGIDFPETSWVGTSVDEQKRVANAEKSFRKVKAAVKWLSVEPMREPIKFNDLSVFDWVVIGGQSKSSGAPEFYPDSRWVIDLTNAATDAGCAVYWKPNTFPKDKAPLREYPKAMTEATR